MNFADSYRKARAGDTPQAPIPPPPVPQERIARDAGFPIASATPQLPPRPATDPLGVFHQRIRQALGLE